MDKKLSEERTKSETNPEILRGGRPQLVRINRTKTLQILVGKTRQCTVYQMGGYKVLMKYVGRSAATWPCPASPCSKSRSGRAIPTLASRKSTTPSYDPQIEQILKPKEPERLQSGYKMGVEGGTSEKDETPHPLQDKGLRLKNKWRGRRGSNSQDEELQGLA